MTACKFADACAGGCVAFVRGVLALPIVRAIGCTGWARSTSQCIAPPLRVSVRVAG